MYKLTIKDAEKLSYEEIMEKMDSTTQSFMYGHPLDQKYMLIQALLNCESPIERMMAYEFMNYNLYYFNVFNPDISVEKYENQYLITINKKSYRADFYIEVKYLKTGITRKFVIECDGHEFHEKTKKQVIKNNERDRELIAAGYIVLHYSGSEIFNKKAYVIVEEIIKTIISYSDRR